MDAFSNDSAFQSITRKRKADGDDCGPQDSSISSDSSSGVEPMLLDSSATPRMPTKAAEAQSTSWLLAQHHRSIVVPWQPSAALSASSVALASLEGPSRPKRPRIEIPQSVPLAARRSRKGRTPLSSAVASPRRFSRHARAGGLRDSGMVSAKDPGPSRSLLVPIQNFTSSRPPSYSAPASPIEPLPSSIPSQQPPVNRDTLKELDLDAILRNPQLRHDLLFDSGLQFRPTSSRRKRDVADNYWLAVERELETGCTCVTVDANGKLRDRVCVCNSFPMPRSRSIRVSSSSGDFSTVRTPSRLKPLLCELLEVLISIIQPVVAHSSSFGMPSGLLHPQYSQSTSHVTYLRSIIDADLIQQEVDHNLFDPSGVFKAIGDIIRCYCAPMRDQAVDQMVKLAQSCAPGGTGTKSDAVRAIRLCFEIMELMKLDVANHQLQTLRPYLIQSSAQFELSMFEESRQKGKLSLRVTRDLLTSVYSELADNNSVTAPDLTVAVFRNAKLSRHTQIQITVTKTIVNLIFNPPPPSSPPHSPSSCSHRKGPVAQPGYPETLYLDHSRLKALGNDVSDLTALYMLLMLYRQLVHASGSSHGPIKLDELLALKKEIWEIGPQHLGHCFIHSSHDSSDTPSTPTVRHAEKSPADSKRWRDDLNNVILQLTTRAGDTSFRTRIPPSTSSSSSLSDSQNTSLDSQSTLRLNDRLPDPAMLQLATSWADTNLRRDAPLCVLMRKRVRRLVEERTIQMVVPAIKTPTSSELAAGLEQDRVVASGLEPLMPEINHLAERLTKLVSIHTNVYGTLYAQPGFLPEFPSP